MRYDTYGLFRIMVLKTLSILNYRNIEQAELTLSPKLNCFVGRNGVGKTNLLDVVYYLSFCRSALGQTNQQVLRHGEDWMVAKGVYDTPEGEEMTISCGLKAGRRKSFKRNGKEYQKLSEHIGLIPLVMLCPQDGELILGGGDVRRKFMDLVISQYAPEYLHSLIRYNQALQQRNTLLKIEGAIDDALLSAYDEQMAVAGQLIYDHRRRFVADFVPMFSEVYAALGNDDEQVSLAYRSHCHDGDLGEMLRSHHEKDHIVGYTLKGVHRDDLEMQLGGFPLRYEGSQGQTKTFLTALKFAQYRYLNSMLAKRKVMNGNAPLLLLDDIFDKLDDERVSRIVSLVASEDYGQIFITSTSDEVLRKVVEHTGKDCRFFSVEGGCYEVC